MPPVLDILIARDGDAWRLYFAPCSWKPEPLGPIEDDSIFPVARPDGTALDRWMRNVGCRIEWRKLVDGGVEVLARGRAAIAVVPWLGRLRDRR
jgi:hypothetical protein